MLLHLYSKEEEKREKEKRTSAGCLDQKLHVKLSYSTAMKWSEWSRTSILGLSFMQLKI